MTRLLEKDITFDFDADCLKAFEFLKGQLVNAPILVAPDWSLPFELMCDASDFTVGAVLGKLRSRWVGPYTVKEVFPHGAIELQDVDGSSWKVNGHRLKHYIGGPIDSVEEDMFLHDIPRLTA
ncbi:uncharacterized protein LOC143561295 [Bidens hawaiensis]|uniref:uncharacterized protein LOC143561295 n=1 Tax=Bidens hawaiensis TaxID=980011 RepID=UPI004049BD2D